MLFLLPTLLCSLSITGGRSKVAIELTSAMGRGSLELSPSTVNRRNWSQTLLAFVSFFLSKKKDPKTNDRLLRSKCKHALHYCISCSITHWVHCRISQMVYLGMGQCWHLDPNQFPEGNYDIALYVPLKTFAVCSSGHSSCTCEVFQLYVEIYKGEHIILIVTRPLNITHKPKSCLWGHGRSTTSVRIPHSICQTAEICGRPVLHQEVCSSKPFGVCAIKLPLVECDSFTVSFLFHSIPLCRQVER